MVRGKSPRMVKTISFGKLYLHAKQLLQPVCSQHLGLRSVADNAARLHHDHALDFRQDVGEMMGNQQNSSSLLRQQAHGVPQFPLGGQIESVAGLVKQEDLGPMHNGSPNQNALGFAYRHLTHWLVAKVLDLQQMKNFIRPLPHLLGNVEVRPQGRARKEARHHRITTCCVRRAFARQFGGNSTQVPAQLGQVPLLAAKDTEVRIFPHQRIALARKRLDQCRFSAAIRPQDGDVFLLADAQRKVVQHDRIAARHRNIFHFNK